MSEIRDLLPARRIWELFGVTDRTLDRWLGDERLAFPRPLYVKNRRYFRKDEIEAWQAARFNRAD